MNGLSNEHGTGALRIGAVARLTGISAHTLRKWEDRYGAVGPQRTEGGERLYTRTDLKRLALIKRLGEAGMPLREVARLSLPELERAWSEVGDGRAADTDGPRATRITVAVLGDVLPALLAGRGPATGSLDVVAGADSIEAVTRALCGAPVDVLVLECPSVNQETRAGVLRVVRNFPAKCAIVVYGFGARRHLAELRGPDMAAIRAPVDPAALEHVARNLLNGVTAPETPAAVAAPAGEGGAVPGRRLSKRTIARMAASAPKTLCECPHHLADIVLSLRAFEDYSAECESRNAQDAELHHFLWVSAARARALFEEAIVRVAAAEGISLED